MAVARGIVIDLVMGTGSESCSGDKIRGAAQSKIVEHEHVKRSAPQSLMRISQRCRQHDQLYARTSISASAQGQRRNERLRKTVPRCIGKGKQRNIEHVLPRQPRG